MNELENMGFKPYNFGNSNVVAGYYLEINGVSLVYRITDSLVVVVVSYANKLLIPVDSLEEAIEELANYL